MHHKKKRNHKNDRVYPSEFKERAIQLALRSPSLDIVARELGIPKGTLYTWVSKVKKGHAIKRKPQTGQPELEAVQANVVSLMEENRRLNKTIATLLEKEAILKKAAAYFAQELK